MDGVDAEKRAAARVRTDESLSWPEWALRVNRYLREVNRLFWPELIVIGGGVANAPDQFLAAIRETVYARSLPLATRDLRIQRSSLGGLAGVIGASSMVVDQLFSRASLARWIEAGEPSGAPEVAEPLAHAG